MSLGAFQNQLRFLVSFVASDRDDGFAKLARKPDFFLKPEALLGDGFSQSKDNVGASNSGANFLPKLIKVIGSDQTCLRDRYAA